MLGVGLWVAIIGAGDCGKTMEELDFELFQKGVQKQQEKEIVELQRETKILKKMLEMQEWKLKQER